MEKTLLRTHGLMTERSDKKKKKKITATQRRNTRPGKDTYPGVKTSVVFWSCVGGGGRAASRKKSVIEVHNVDEKLGSESKKLRLGVKKSSTH